MPSLPSLCLPLLPLCSFPIFVRSDVEALARTLQGPAYEVKEARQARRLKPPAAVSAGSSSALVAPRSRPPSSSSKQHTSDSGLPSFFLSSFITGAASCQL